MKKHPKKSNNPGNDTPQDADAGGPKTPVIDTAEANAQQGRLLVAELVAAGIDYAVISPGSRSTPITAAVARHPRMRSFVALDERGAAFHALGYARSVGRAAVLICTSGSALANYFPAIVEAYNDRVPLIILSADRPPELRDTGANQTMDQVKMFGQFTRWWAELPCPDGAVEAKVVRSTVNQLVFRSQHATAGPVHLNCQFREPLLPGVPQKIDEQAPVAVEIARPGQSRTNYVGAQLVPPVAEMEALAKLLSGHERGLIVVGRMGNGREAETRAAAAVQLLADTLNWPVLADVRSSLRRSGVLRNGIAYYDRILLEPEMRTALRADTILHFGDQLCSKNFLQWIESLPPRRYIAVKNHYERHDPTHSVTARFACEAEQFCSVLLTFLERKSVSPWTQNWLAASHLLESLMAQGIDTLEELSEVGVARMVARNVPREWSLFSASSMPIRYLDMFCVGTNAQAIVANRGVSGIDGNLASAAGYSAGSAAGLTVLIGDLAFIHDVNSLLHLRGLSNPVVIVLLNNSGGGIFSLLPVANHSDIFEQYFGTPHAADFSAASRFAGVEHFLVVDPAEFEAAYRSALERNHTCIIEVQTKRTQNAELLASLNDLIQRSLRAALRAGDAQNGDKTNGEGPTGDESGDENR